MMTFLIVGIVVLALFIAWAVYVIIGGGQKTSSNTTTQTQEPEAKPEKKAEKPTSFLAGIVSGLGPLAKVILVVSALVFLLGTAVPYMMSEPMQAPTSLYPMSDRLERGKPSERIFVPPLERYPLFFELRHSEFKNNKGQKVRVTLDDLDIRIQGYQESVGGLKEDGPAWKWKPGMTLHRHKYFRYMLGENAKVKELPKGMLWIVRDETREE